ncbi:FGFR2 [Mytilus coruscus]|uniref:receptor protein-tyrosine kinase n=1 Tax=Mytilus coruscus TaxID=42192 RepID=A0A6J8DKD0_MYTCO|nr:FGFR2 [Mytilus coruscus]
MGKRDKKDKEERKAKKKQKVEIEAEEYDDFEEESSQDVKSDSSPSWKPKSRPAQGDHIVTKNEGNDFKLTCGVNGNPKPSIVWYKDGRVFDDKKRLKTKLHRYSLIMKDAQVDDTGDYQCTVTNVHGSLNFTFYVRVIKLAWPLQVEKPQNQTVNEGDDAIFTCRALNDPEATINWVKRIQTGLHTSIGKISDIIENKEILVLRSVNMSDAGHYVCFVGNLYGLKHVDVWLTVIPTTTPTTTTTTKEEDNNIKLTWPLEVEEPQNQTVNEGDDAIFTCRPLNDPEATIKWVKRIQTGLQTSIGKTADVSYLTILQLQFKLYWLMVTYRDFGDEQLRQRYRFGRETIEFLVNELKGDLETSSTKKTALTVEQQVMIALRFYGSGSQMQVVGDIMGFDKSTVPSIISVVTDAYR